MLINPTWILASSLHSFHFPCRTIQPIARRGSELPCSVVSKPTQDVDIPGDVRGGVKVCRWENILWVSQDLEFSGRAMDDDFIVNVEVTVIVIFVFTADLHESAVWESRKRTAETIKAPNRTMLFGYFSKLNSSTMSGNSRTHHLFPKGYFHDLGIGYSKTWTITISIFLFGHMQRVSLS